VGAGAVVNVEYAGTVSGSPATVTAGGTASASVTYAVQPGTGALWVAGGNYISPNVDNKAIEYTAAQLQASSAVTPAVTLSFAPTAGGNIDASGVAFDHQGNMWIVNDNSNTVVEYGVALLAASSTPTPTVTLSLPSGSDSYALAFDGQGNLWVANNGGNDIVEFTAAQLTASGAPTPAITISETPPQPGNLQEPIGLAFDAHGNLWVANNAVSGIVEYSASQLTTSGSPTPAVTLTGNAILYPNDIAFDSSGNLWISNSAYTNGLGDGRIVEYSASVLSAGGSPPPTTVIDLPPGGQYGAVPTGLAFDNAGNLWYADAYNSLIGEYSAGQLTSGGGNLSPTISISNPSLVSGVGIAFDPHSTALPLH
jgi:sugar lactone lactonase YvrE